MMKIKNYRFKLIIFCILFITINTNIFSDAEIQNITINPTNPLTNTNITITFQIRTQSSSEGNAMFAIGLSTVNNIAGDDLICRVNWLATEKGIYQGSGTPSTVYWWLDGVSQTASGMTTTDVVGPNPGISAGSGTTWKTVTVITRIPPEHAGSNYYINIVTRAWGDLKAQCCGAGRNFNNQYANVITINGITTIKADLEICDSSTIQNGVNDEIRVGFKIINRGESGIFLDRFSFRYYIFDNLTCSNWSGQSSTGFQAYFSNGSTYCGAQNPTTQASCQDLPSTIDCGNSRKANKYLVFSTTSLPSRPYLIPPANGYFLTTSPLPYWRSNPRPIDNSDDYTRTIADAPACNSGNYGDVREVSLYYESQLLCEYVDYSNFESNSGTEPCYQNLFCSPTPTPLISIYKSASRTIVPLGDTVTFCLSITNNTNNSQTFNIWDTVPTVLTYRGCDNNCNTVTIGGNFIVYWTISSLAPGATVTRCFWAEATSLPQNLFLKEFFVRFELFKDKEKNYFNN